MNWKPAGGTAIRIANASHATFAAIMITFGILGLIKRDFTPLWQPVPKSVPARELLIFFCAVIPLAGGIGLLWGRTAPAAARVLFAYFLFWLLVLRVPRLFISLTVDVWWPGCQTAVMTAAAWVVYVSFAGGWDRRHFGFITGDSGIRMARILYGLALIPFGLAHFMYLQVTAELVPGWIPAHATWAYFTGYTFIAAGLAIIIGIYPRLAATLSGLQMGLFTLLVWVPVVTMGANASQRAEFIVSCALTAGGWIMANSCHRHAVVDLGQTLDAKSKCDAIS